MIAVVSVSVFGSWTWECPTCGVASSLKPSFENAAGSYASHVARMHEGATS